MFTYNLNCLPILTPPGEITPFSLKMATLLTVIWHISHTFSYTLPENHIVKDMSSPLDTAKHMHCTDIKK